MAKLTQALVILQEIKNITQNDVRDRLPLSLSPYRSTAKLILTARTAVEMPDRGRDLQEDCRQCGQVG
jgi:hypothetical protein